jgi:2-keto-4-pentenoate hydratase/2-oxohepta-3-ene-1,7-dioic acid hydratase in catechol pathway
MRVLDRTPDAPARAPLLARYRVVGATHHGLLDGALLARLSAAPWDGGAPTGESDDAGAVEMLTPCAPSKIICIGLNYIEHVRESLTLTGAKEPPKEPLFFLKPPSSALASGGAIEHPGKGQRLDPEGEVALVIGKRARHVAVEHALEYVAGITAFNDVSARDWQKSDGQWARAKGCDTFAPFGPVIALGVSPLDVAFLLRVNGQTRQSARTSGMHFGPAFLVHHLSRYMTLEPGDVIATGTPAGIAPIVVGDRVEVELDLPGFPVLTNAVVAAGHGLS